MVGLTLKTRLAILVAGTALPLVLFASITAYREYINDRQEAEQYALGVARSVRISLDGELRSEISALRTLSLSQPLETGDLVAFREQAERFLSQFPEGPNLSVADASGQQLLNMRAPPGQALPPRADQATTELVIKSGQPHVSNLFVGAVSQRPIATVNVPVFQNGRVVKDIAFTASIETFRKIASEQRPNDQWVITILDGTGTIIARDPSAEAFFGKKVSPTLLPKILAEREAITETVSLEGIRLLTAFTRSEVSDWRVAVGLPVTFITTPLWTSLALTLFVGLCCVLIGLLFAVRLATNIARAEALHNVMLNELNHRVGNTLAIVQSIAAQTFSLTTDPKEARKAFDSRLVALAEAHRVLGEEKWKSATLKDIIFSVLRPYGLEENVRLYLSGPMVHLAARYALMISMVLHELATNAAKYGALCQEGGSVSIQWNLFDNKVGRRLTMRWKESGGPPVRKSDRKGFGSALIEKIFVAQFGGSTSLSFEETGLVATIEFYCELA